MSALPVWQVHNNYAINYTNIQFAIIKLCKSPLFKWNITFCLHYISFQLTNIPRVYNYIINEEGQPMYLGTHTSVIFYNKSMSSWVWWDQAGFLAPNMFSSGNFFSSGMFSSGRYDRKDPSSVAVSLSPEASLLLGLEDFCLDFTFQKSQNHLV